MNILKQSTTLFFSLLVLCSAPTLFSAAAGRMPGSTLDRISRIINSAHASPRIASPEQVQEFSAQKANLERWLAQNESTQQSLRLASQKIGGNARFQSAAMGNQDELGRLAFEENALRTKIAEYNSKLRE